MSSTHNDHNKANIPEDQRKYYKSVSLNVIKHGKVPYYSKYVSNHIDIRVKTDNYSQRDDVMVM